MRELRFEAIFDRILVEFCMDVNGCFEAVIEDEYSNNRYVCYIDNWTMDIRIPSDGPPISDYVLSMDLYEKTKKIIKKNGKNFVEKNHTKRQSFADYSDSDSGYTQEGPRTYKIERTDEKIILTINDTDDAMSFIFEFEKSKGYFSNHCILL